MSVATVRDYLKPWGKDSAIREYAVSSATVELAAKAAGVEPARIAKTLSFKLDDGCVLVVMAGDARLKNGKFKAQFGKKPMMCSAEEALEWTGHAVGGVCPFAIANPAVRVYLDVSLKRFATVLPAAGSSNSSVELTCDELFDCSRAAAWVDVCSGWNGE